MTGSQVRILFAAPVCYLSIGGLIVTPELDRGRFFEIPNRRLRCGNIGKLHCGRPTLLGFKTHSCEIVAPDGSVRSSTQAQFTGDLIIIEGKETVVFTGDEIRRELPNGTDETFEVIDPTFYDT